MMETIPPSYHAVPGVAREADVVRVVLTGDHRNLRFIDWIWRIRGSVPLPPGQSSDEAFARLDPLFHETGTRHERTGDTLTFTKTNQAAQDRMSVFDGGALRIDGAGGRPTLRYQLASRALLACFLAPLLFLGLSEITIVLKRYDKPPAADKKDAKKEAAMPLNPIDKALGAPPPDKPKTGHKADSDDDDKKLSPKPGYVFAGIFAALYVIGRILEDRQVKALFRKRLMAES
jgi:hypothetical protein